MDIVEGVQEASSSALETINELLCFEKLAAGHNAVEPADVLLIPYLRECMHAHRVAAAAKNISLDLDLQTDRTDASIFVSLDVVKFKIVMRNLLSNAIKFSPENGQVWVRVEIKAANAVDAADGMVRQQSRKFGSKPEATSATAKESMFVVISVRDSGAGMTAENLSLLFNEGMQFNANKLQGGGGSGFGLYITKGIVEQHRHARIWAESEGEGRGSTFFVMMPLMDAKPGASFPPPLTGSDSRIVVPPMWSTEPFTPRLEPSMKKLLPTRSTAADVDSRTVVGGEPSIVGAQISSLVSTESMGPAARRPSHLAAGGGPAASAKPPVGRVLNVLVVDDSPANRKMVR